jgi:hypothetical protein
MALFPPWRRVDVVESDGLAAVEIEAGYSFLFSPPRARPASLFAAQFSAEAKSPRVDMSFLSIQWVIVVAVAGILLTFSGRRTREKKLRRLVDS